MYVLVETNHDYADEFDCPAFEVMKKEKWEKVNKELEEKLKGNEKEWEIGFGTNEAIIIESFDDIKRGVIKVTDITEEDAIKLDQLFNHYPSKRLKDQGVRVSFGLVPFSRISETILQL